jgi:PAS domain S-box-containing protein
MHDVTSIRLPGRGIIVRSPSIRGSALLTASVTVMLSFLIAAGALYWHAAQDRHAIAHQGLATSAATASILDREAEALGNLLRGLSRSPLLESNELGAFHRQLTATPRPEGSRFILWTPQRQLLNTGFPFGATLPRIEDLPPTQQRLDLLRRTRLLMSERFLSPVTGKWTIAVSVPLDGPDGGTDRILTLAVPEDHLGRAQRDSRLPDGWKTIILDHHLKEVMWDGRPHPSAAHLSRDLVRELEAGHASGHFESDSGGESVLVAFDRSDATGYTVLSTMLTASVDAPVHAAMVRIGLAGIALLLVGAASTAVALRNLKPFDALAASAATTRTDLLATNVRLGAILGSISDCYLTLDRAYRITDINAAAIRWFGLPRSDVIGRSYFDLVGHHPAFDAALAQAVEDRREFTGEVPSIYHPGRYIDYRVFPSPEGASVFFSDVTERHTAHRAALREREFLQASVDALSAHVAILDGSGTVISVNEAWHRFARENGYAEPSHGVGTSYLDTCTRAGPAEGLLADLRAVLTGLRPDCRGVYRCDAPDGARWFQLRATRFMADARAHVIVAHEDITDIVAAREEVGELSERLLGLQEEERRRIASELHDSTAQRLVAVGLSLMQVEAIGLPPAGRRIIDEIDRSLDEALKELRVFTYLLHPPGLETDGLAATVRTFAMGFANRSGLNVTVRIDEAADGLPADLRHALFRIVQEGLANVHRHARASRVAIDLRLTPTEAILCVADDGRGMRARPDEATPQRATLGVGIPGMRIRLSQFGGTLKIRSSRRGTVVRAAAPLAVPSAAAER